MYVGLRTINTVLNMQLKVTSQFIVFAVKTLILRKISIVAFTIFLVRTRPFLVAIL